MGLALRRARLNSAIFGRRSHFDHRYRYRIEYTDDSDVGCPVFSAVWRGYDKADALDRFLGAPDGDGLKITGKDTQ